ncbi:Hypothetical predicted protein [Mytilus galloprovincialis]|uniref:C-type lectin domain-containing protein n=1 Tax=Mytilus galloprovincialis TaxID=29158 RepID=A0A8B6BTK8_MYTGA|nr:Hypothetical predicted protein [Mytilus galloprovincialis]
MDMAMVKDSAELEVVKTYIASVGGPGKNIWIGMVWDKTNQVHKWLDGEVVSWAPWTSGEPDCTPPSTIGCDPPDQDVVRMTASYAIRTYDKSMSNDVLCEVLATTTTVTTTVHMVQESDSKLSLIVIIGLSAGFGGFFLLCCMCCFLWKCLCGSKDDNKIEHTPEVNEVTVDTTEQMKLDNPWMKQEEISFCLRQNYVFDLPNEIVGKRHKYIK